MPLCVHGPAQRHKGHRHQQQGGPHQQVPIKNFGQLKNKTKKQQQGGPHQQVPIKNFGQLKNKTKKQQQGGPHQQVPITKTLAN